MSTDYEAKPEAEERGPEPVTCILHEAVVPCARCAADDESYLAFLRGQSRIAGALATSAQAAQTAVADVYKQITRQVNDGDLWEIGAAELADALAEAAIAAAALRRIRRITGLFAAKAGEELADMGRHKDEKDAEVARLRAEVDQLQRRLADHCGNTGSCDVCEEKAELQRIDAIRAADAARYHGLVPALDGSLWFCASAPGHKFGCRASDGHVIITAAESVDGADPVEGEGSDVD